MVSRCVLQIQRFCVPNHFTTFSPASYIHTLPNNWLLTFVLTTLFCVSPSTHAQGLPTVSPSVANASANFLSGNSGKAPSPSVPASTAPALVDLLVSVREPGGTPLSASAAVKLYVKGGLHLKQHTQDNATATFSKISAGEYEIEVSAFGYKTSSEHAIVYSNRAQTRIYVYLHRQGEAFAANAAGAMPIMTPHLQHELEKGLEKMQKQQYAAARAQFQKAIQLAPGNPQVQYLFGMLEYTQGHLDAARAKFQTALAIFPSHEGALVALGELQLRTGDPLDATATLEKAYETNGADWHTHFLLAQAYLQQDNFDEALAHAKRAAVLGKGHAAGIQTLVSQILAQKKVRERSTQAPSNATQNLPADRPVHEAAFQSRSLIHDSDTSAGPLTAPAAPNPPPHFAGSVPSWAPPDVDSKEYAVASDVPCSQDEVLDRTQIRLIRQMNDLERFEATEHVVHQQVDSYGIPRVTHAKDFSYVVLVTHPANEIPYLDERRDGGESLDAFPTPLATRGLFALALNVFGPNFRNDFIYRCEGLGSWRGQAAWQMRFEQKMSVPSHIRFWRDDRGIHALALKGRAWISSTGYDVLHLETDLREPAQKLGLTRDHLLIDYGPVTFNYNGTVLWLPWGAEMFMELRGKRYHHTHTLRDYRLFSVDTTYTLGKPKEVATAEPH
jgi:tetratricopeptide (TPR) repeat protein